MSILLALLVTMQSAQNDALRDAPTVIKTEAKRECTCTQPAADNTDEIIVHGLVTGARLFLAPDGLKPADRQATIFSVSKSLPRKVVNTSEQPIYHNTNTTKCGITFDYGRTYKIAVRKNEKGELETDFCRAQLSIKAEPGETNKNKD